MKKTIAILSLVFTACGGDSSRYPSAEEANVGGSALWGSWCHDFVQNGVMARETQTFKSNGVMISEVREVETEKLTGRHEQAWTYGKGRVELFFPGAESGVSFKPVFKQKDQRQCFTAEDRYLNGKPEPRVQGAAPLQKCRCD